MRIVSAVFIGLLSGFLIYMIVDMFVGIENVNNPALFILFTFLGGWIVSTFILLQGATTTAKVWARGGLLGAAEWMVAGLAPMIVSSRLLAGSGLFTTGDRAAQSGAAIGVGIFSLMGLGVAVFMAIVCLIIYFIASRSPSEFQPETTRVKCPECAEWIAEEAKKCRFCGASIV